MATAWVDQITGNGETVAYKAPCRVATTADVPLSGLLTVDGVTLDADDRVLVKDQADASQNGIYIATSGIWQRARDFDSNRDVTKGTRVTVTDGSANAGREYALFSENPINVGVSPITITETLSSDTGGNAADAIAAAAAALVSEQNAHASAVAAAADRVQTGLDRVATGADRVQTGLDAAAANADRIAAGNAAAAALISAGNAATSEGNASAAESTAVAAAGAATTARNKAEQWATNPEDAPVEVAPDRFSALHWARKAAAAVLDGLAGMINSAAVKTTPADDDRFPLTDSADSYSVKRTTWTDMKAALSTMFVTLSGGTQQVVTRRTTFKGSTGGIAVVEWGGEQIEIAADTASDVAFVTFHIPGIAAANFGMGSDSQFRRGGKGVGANSYLFWDHGNVNVGGFAVPTAPTASGHVATKGYVDGQDIGIGQTWQDVSGSRANNTVYQNTTGKPIQLRVFIPGSGGGILYVSADNLTWVQLGRTNTANDQYPIIPPGYYYKVDGGNFNGWTELR